MSAPQSNRQEDSSADTSMSSALERASHHARAFLAALDSRAVAATVSRQELLSRLDLPLGREGVPARVVVDELAAAVEGGLLGSASGRFFAWVIGGGLPAAVATEWLTSAWDQNAAIYATSPASAAVEEVAGKWLLDVLRLPHDASFAFTTGCQMAHFTALCAARDQLLHQCGWNVTEQGLAGSPPVRAFATALRHVSFDRALRYLGIGSRQLHVLPVGADGRLDYATLEAALSHGSGPAIIALNAGDLNLGVFDSFATLVPLARRHGAWVHIDGAFGMFARASPRFDALTAGLELADSWATDCHKWLNVPPDCGFVVVRHRDAHLRALTVRDSYFVAEDAARDQIDWNPEWSRRARGFPVYAALRELGRDGLTSLIDRCVDHCGRLVDGIGALPGAEVVWRPTINQGLVRFLGPSADASPEEHDARTDDVINRINRSGEAMFGGVTWNGRRAMRVSVVNWRTTAADIDRTVAAVARVVADGAHVTSPVS
jgi:glutamate/tyrosine decarboxylase-like PLP-dependent enzyme